MNWGELRNHGRAKIPKFLCEMGKTWKYSLRSTLKKYQF